MSSYVILLKYLVALLNTADNMSACRLLFQQLTAAGDFVCVCVREVRITVEIYWCTGEGTEILTVPPPWHMTCSICLKRDVCF